MDRHTDLTSITGKDHGACVAMGNFDGVHRGHQTVIRQAAQIAEDAFAPLGVITFEPHPRSFFAPKAPAFRLMNATARAHRMDLLGVQKLYEIPFNQDLAQLSAEAFVEDILIRSLGIRHLVVGNDFGFGKGRSGNVDLLREYALNGAFGLTMAPLLQAVGQPVTSTAIRAALTEGRPGNAAKMLGHRHRIEGPVIKGEQRGRELGFPTANIRLDGLHLPKFGVYAVLFDVMNGPHKGTYHGAASLGVRPMFGENTPNLETFVLDFDGDLYGADVSVALVEFIRAEAKFNSVEALITQMGEDVEKVRRHLTTL